MSKYKFVSASGFRGIETLVNEFADDEYRIVQVGHERVGCDGVQVWWAVMELTSSASLEAEWQVPHSDVYRQSYLRRWFGR